MFNRCLFRSTPTALAAVPCARAWPWVLLVVGGLAACGGGAEVEGAKTQPAGTATANAPIELASPRATTRARPTEAQVMQEGAALNRQELEEAALADRAQRANEPLELVEPTEQTSQAAFSKAGGSPVAVYRFYNTLNGAHFYTTSAAERDSTRSRLPNFRYEGAAFDASSTSAPGLAPVYRFYNSQTGVHFYTISESEKDRIRDGLAQFRLEGVAYYASQVPATGFRPLYRAYVQAKGFHFYSIDAAETAGLSQYRAEGVGYYVVGTAPATPAPTPGNDTTCGLANFQAEFMEQMNVARATPRSCGGNQRAAVAPVTWNAALATAAARHSLDMASNNFFSHTGSNGSNLGTRATAAGYAGRGLGENIAAGQADVRAVMDGWLKSAGHCNNIMNPGFNHVALACVSRSGTTYGKYWTMSLGNQ